MNNFIRTNMTTYTKQTNYLKDTIWQNTHKEIHNMGKLISVKNE